MFCIPKILKNESNSQRVIQQQEVILCCFVSQRYWKMKAIHNVSDLGSVVNQVVLYPKDTEKWKQFTTCVMVLDCLPVLFCIPKILKNESNSQLKNLNYQRQLCCFVSQRYWKMKAIHNKRNWVKKWAYVVLYPKDTEKWKQFTTTTN